MNRCRVSFATAILVLSVAQTPMLANEIQPSTSNATNLHSVKTPSHSKNLRNAEKASLDSKAVAPTEEHRIIESYTVVDEITHTKPGDQDDKSETAQSFNAPAGALYTTSDDCG